MSFDIEGEWVANKLLVVPPGMGPNSTMMGPVSSQLSITQSTKLNTAQQPSDFPEILYNVGFNLPIETAGAKESSNITGTAQAVVYGASSLGFNTFTKDEKGNIKTAGTALLTLKPNGTLVGSFSPMARAKPYSDSSAPNVSIPFLYTILFTRKNTAALSQTVATGIFERAHGNNKTCCSKGVCVLCDDDTFSAPSSILER